MSTILIVDDLPANREFLITVLRDQGHRLLEAANGREGLAAAHAEGPDLVITDVLMPVMDGYEFVRQLRLDPATRAIPVLFYTASYGAREARALALSSGLRYVLTKPAAAEEVLTIVGRVLSGESAAGTAADADPVTTEDDREHLRLLTDELSEKTGDLKISNARLRAVINIGLELASERDSDRLLQRVCVSTRDLFGAAYVTLGILDRHDRTVQRFVTSGVDGAADWIKTGDAVSGILSAVIAERRAVRGDNHADEQARLHFPLLHPDVESFLAAPIASPTHVYGWICLVGTGGRIFTDNDEHLVMAISGLVGRIYENGYFASVAQKRADELEREVVERNRATEALRVAEERMRFALEAAGVGIWDMDFTTGVLRWSEILESHYGLPPGTFGGTREAFIERVHPQDRAALLETMAAANRSGGDFVEEHRTIWPDGTLRWLSGAGRVHLGAHGEPVRAVGIAQDITQRRLMEDQYHQAQKMEVVGRLAGGVAHDFNNLLTSILGYCDLLLADVQHDDPRCADIAEIRKAGTCAAGLTHQLLAFSRKQIIEPTVLDVNVVAAGVRSMLGRLIGEDVKVVLRLAPEPAPVKADRGQVEQVIMNLAVNARDAMPGGGTLTMETANVELDARYAKTHVAVAPGPYVVLTVTDTGTGVTPDVRAHMFEPFFTTKAPGIGTGLGLATVHSIVAQSGGSIDVHSEAGQGTSFTLYFPRANATEIVVDAPPLAQPRPSAGWETVLVVDDEEGLRTLARRLLQRQGYTVLIAANADEARRLFEQHRSIDVLLTDVVLPGASGLELARQLVAQRPMLKVVYMSGYTADAIARQGVLNPGITFLSKPFNAEMLGRKIREALDRPVAGVSAGARVA